MRRAAAAALGGAVLLLTGCTAGGHGSASGGSPTASPTSPSASTSAPPPKPAAAPPVGACYRFGVQAASRTSIDVRPVPCRGPHTAVTYSVGRLRKLTGKNPSTTSPAVAREMAGACTARLRGFVGGSPALRQLSRIQPIWFSPTAAEVAGGARWFRCDVVVLQDDTTFLGLKGHTMHRALDRRNALDTFGLCGTARPGSRGFRRVVCAVPHSWRAISVIRIRGGNRYPGIARVRRAGDQTCANQVQRTTSALKFSYGWEWPTRRQWRSGQHFGYCWAPA